MSVNKKFRLTGAALLLVGLTVAAAQPAWAYPEPRIVSNSWQLEFESAKPTAISVDMPGEQGPQLYWYMTYTVENQTGRDRLFIPEAWVLTDAGDLIPANRGVPSAVFRAIERREQNQLLQSPANTAGRLLQGEDNARDGVLIWPVPDHDVDFVRIFFAGLSGETHEVQDPLTGETRVLRKTLMLAYSTPGDTSHREGQPFILESRAWVVR